jgi:hypothetical protein
VLLYSKSICYISVASYRGRIVERCVLICRMTGLAVNSKMQHSLCEMSIDIQVGQINIAR